DGHEDVILLAPVMVNLVQVLVKVGQDTVGNRRRQVIVNRASARRSWKVFHPLESQGALLGSRDDVPRKWSAGDHAARNDLRLRSVDRDVPIGKIARAILHGRNRNQWADSSSEAAQVLLIVEKIGFVLGSPHKRQEWELHRAANKTAELVFIVLGALIAGSGLVGEL